MITLPRLMLLAAAGSLALLLGAFAFQYIGGLAPCKMCLWQRWPHAFAVVVGAVTIIISWRALPLLGAAAAFTSACIGAFHAGVEHGWWDGPSTCTSGPVENLSADQLFDQIMSAPLVRCDEIAWAWMGLSMAGWNAVLSLGLACLWLTVVFRWRSAGA